MKQQLRYISVFIFLIVVNYLLIIFFLNAYYLFYFAVVFFVSYLLYKIGFGGIKYLFLIYLFLFSLSSFLVEHFDVYLFDMYLFFDLEKFYTFVGGGIIYILSVLHSIIFFFSVFKKN